MVVCMLAVDPYDGPYLSGTRLLDVMLFYGWVRSKGEKRGKWLRLCNELVHDGYTTDEAGACLSHSEPLFHNPRRSAGSWP